MLCMCYTETGDSCKGGALPRKAEPQPNKEQPQSICARLYMLCMHEVHAVHVSRAEHVHL